MTSNIYVEQPSKKLWELEISYLDSAASKKVDERLMQHHGFSIDQLMELAGLSVACAVGCFHNKQCLSSNTSLKKSTIVVFCGPGNNGGDGLVAARHLKHFGYLPSVVYPKKGKGVLFANLVQQMLDLDIPVLDTAPSKEEYSNFDLAVDAVFGFSFEGPSREPFTSIIQTFAESTIPVIAVDIPSGWHVEEGDKFSTGYTPHAVVSLTAPKLCMRNYTGVHYVGGRFVHFLIYGICQKVRIKSEIGCDISI